MILRDSFRNILKQYAKFEVEKVDSHYQVTMTVKSSSFGKDVSQIIDENKDLFEKSFVKSSYSSLTGTIRSRITTLTPEDAPHFIIENTSAHISNIIESIELNALKNLNIQHAIYADQSAYSHKNKGNTVLAKFDFDINKLPKLIATELKKHGDKIFENTDIKFSKFFGKIKYEGEFANMYVARDTISKKISGLIREHLVSTFENKDLFEVGDVQAFVHANPDIIETSKNNDKYISTLRLEKSLFSSRVVSAMSESSSDFIRKNPDIVIYESPDCMIMSTSAETPTESFSKLAEAAGNFITHSTSNHGLILLKGGYLHVDAKTQSDNISQFIRKVRSSHEHDDPVLAN